MAKKSFTFSGEVIVYPGMNAWRFLMLPKKTAAEIKTMHGQKARGWGSLKVVATIGNTTWETSIFPYKQSQSYLLPLKSKIRSSEGILDDETVTCELRIV